FPPKLVQPPAIGPDGRLRLTGFFDTRPERVMFDLMFEDVDANWKLFGIALDVAAPEGAAAQPPPADSVKQGKGKAPAPDGAENKAGKGDAKKPPADKKVDKK